MTEALASTIGGPVPAQGPGNHPAGDDGAAPGGDPSTGIVEDESDQAERCSMTKRQDETEAEHYARRREYFRAHYQKMRVSRLMYQKEYYERPGQKERKKEYDRSRREGVKA